MTSRWTRSRSGRRRLLPWLAVFAFAATIAATGRAQPQAEPGAARSVWAAVYSKEQAARGEPLYAKSCALCHGPALEGGEMAPPLTGGAFNANWNGLTLGDLLERIRVSMPQDNPNSLPRQAYVEILAFMLQSGGFPNGRTDLPRETEVLKQITFEATKP